MGDPHPYMSRTTATVDLNVSLKSLRALSCYPEVNTLKWFFCSTFRQPEFPATHPNPNFSATNCSTIHSTSKRRWPLTANLHKAGDDGLNEPQLYKAIKTVLERLIKWYNGLCHINTPALCSCSTHRYRVSVWLHCNIETGRHFSAFMTYVVFISLKQLMFSQFSFSATISYSISTLCIFPDTQQPFGTTTTNSC